MSTDTTSDNSNSAGNTNPQKKDNVANNRRIAKNTLLLYVRMIVVMLVSLYTSRLVLATLGVVDYGIYNVVGGLVGLFTIISGSLSVSTSRFLTYGLGKGDMDELKKTFSTVRAVHIALAIGMFILCELLAVWFLQTKLNIPSERMHAAEIVLHCSIFSFCISLLNVPFRASVVSHEKMAAFAYMSILDVVVKLLIVYLLYISPIDKLIFYAILGVGVTLLYQGVYMTYCILKFPECKSKPKFNRSIAIEISRFVGWTFLGNAAVVAKDQGVVMLLNIFFGPVVNAAQGVGNQVNGVASRFIEGFMTAVIPQITKSYAADEKDRLNHLLIKSTKFSFFLMVVLMFPIINNTSTLINLWLVEVPDHAIYFANLILIYTFIDCFTTPIYTAVIATAKIKTYEIVLTILYAFNLLCAYVALKLGAIPEVVFVIAIFFKLLVLFLLLHQAYKLCGFDLKAYGMLFLKVIIPTLVLCLAISFIYQFFVKSDSFLKLIVFSVVFEAIVIPFFWKICLEPTEREFLKNTIIHKFIKTKS